MDSHYAERCWLPRFSEDCNYKDDELYAEGIRQDLASGSTENVKLEGDDTTYFACDYEDDTPAIKELSEFLRGAKVDELEKALGIAGKQRGAWVDDRHSPLPRDDTDLNLRKDRVMAATGLYRIIKEPRYDNSQKPDTNRRLIHIRNMNPYHALALAKTVRLHELTLLRDNLFAHLASQTYMQITVSEDHFPLFTMELNLTFCKVVKRAEIDKSGHAESLMLSKRWRRELSFAKPKLEKPQAQELLCAFQVSFSIRGSDNTRWTGYCFEDDDLVENVGDDPAVNRDPISIGKLDANLPLWSPREYFLFICRCRFEQAQIAWVNVVRWIEVAINEYTENHLTALSEGPSNEKHLTQDVKATFDWTQQTIRILNDLIGMISQNIDAWKTFSAKRGPISYFSDIRGTVASIRTSIGNIENSVTKMERSKGTLEHLMKSCKVEAKSLGLLLGLESNMAVQSNGQTAAFTLSIISPIMLTAQLYSIAPETAPFTLHGKFFPLVIGLIMAVMQCLIVAVQMLPGKPWWYRILNTWSQRVHGEAIAYQDFWRNRLRHLNSVTVVPPTSEELGIEEGNV